MPIRNGLLTMQDLTTILVPLEGKPTTPGTYLLKYGSFSCTVVKVLKDKGLLVLYLEKIATNTPILVQDTSPVYKWYGPLELLD
jgi:hypothetical protein